MSKKRLDPTAISNELRGASLHFMRAPLQAEPSPTVATVPSSEEKPRNLETYEPRNLEKEVVSNTKRTEERKQEAIPEPPKKVSPTRKPLKQYNTMLEAEHILAIKRLALEEGKKDYEVVQEALISYLKKKGTL